MVKITEVRAANVALKNRHESMSAVFVGATSGIGKATLQAFAKHIPRPRAIIVGRSAAKFENDLAALRALNAAGEFTFLEAAVDELHNIDLVSAAIKKHLPASGIDLLVMSQGYVGFSGREETVDGLDRSTALRYYGRLRFAENLAHLLSPRARVLSVLAGGQEGQLIEDDLDLERNYSVVNSATHVATMTTLSFDKMAAQYPEQAFLHVFPGLVSTGLLGRSATGVLGFVFRWAVEPLLSFASTQPGEAGERMLYYLTTDRFSQGSWSLDWDGTPKEQKVLVEYRQRGFAQTVAEHNQRIFARAASRIS